MAKKKKTKAKFTTGGALLKNGIYAVKAARPKRRRKKAAISQDVAHAKSTGAAIDKGKKMALIEAYAKANRVTITQAMVHFMQHE